MEIATDKQSIAESTSNLPVRDRMEPDPKAKWFAFESSKKTRHRAVYFHVALECDTPILEALHCSQHRKLIFTGFERHEAIRYFRDAFQRHFAEENIYDIVLWRSFGNSAYVVATTGSRATDIIAFTLILNGRKNIEISIGSLLPRSRMMARTYEVTRDQVDLQMGFLVQYFCRTAYKMKSESINIK
jgi:hypothetical protein